MDIKYQYLLIFVVILFCHVYGGRYSEKVNTKINIKDDSPFRIYKLNLIWQKAKKRVEPKDLENLYVDLKMQDKLELETKKKKAEGLDEEGEFEALARRKVHDLLSKYDLLDTHHDTNNEIMNETWEKDIKTIRMESIKSNKKLEKLWKKAELSGFTEQELEDLKTEFVHHQQKIDEYNQFKTEVDNFEDNQANTINQFKDSDDLNLKQMKKDLKNKHNLVKNGYEFLEKATDKSLDTADFEEPKTLELWFLAQKSNFTAEELASIKEELHHFDHKLKKHRVFSQQYEISKDSKLKPGKENQIPDSLVKMELKVDEYGRKVKKYHTEIKDRIMARHSEL